MRCGIHHVFQSNHSVGPICMLRVPFFPRLKTVKDIKESVFLLSDASNSSNRRQLQENSVSHLKFQFSPLIICITFLSTLRCLKSFLNQLDLVCHLLDTNLSRLINMFVLGPSPVQGHLAFPSIQTFIRCHSN
jgi:hypothetical protein